MERLNLQFIASCLDQILDCADQELSLITTDSRRVIPGSLFVAITGDKMDGHDFIADAAGRGARAVICRTGTDVSAHPVLYPFYVDDTLVAFRSVAAKWRSHFNLTPLIAVAGSVGKTTTKELIAALLRGKWTDILKTQGSQNGFLGIPMTLVELRPHHSAAVVEIGIDDVGAMAQHLDVVQPSHGIVTAIGAEHLEKLKDLETVTREETLILHHVTKTGGVAVVNLNDDHIAPLAAPLQSASPKTLVYRLVDEATDLESLGDPTFKGLMGQINKKDNTLRLLGMGLDTGATLPLPLPGRHNAINLLAAATVARSLGLSLSEMKSGIETFKNAPGRSQTITAPWKTGQITIFADHYNANPQSVRAALDTVRGLKASGGAKRLIVCLADMLELGEKELDLHAGLAPDVTNNLSKGAIDMVFLLGERMKSLAAALNQTKSVATHGSYATHDELWQKLKTVLEPGDLILIKGSRSMRMEQILERITG